MGYQEQFVMIQVSLFPLVHYQSKNMIFCCVFTEKPLITTHPQGDHVLKEGDNVTLSCNATGNPAPTISWTRDGSAIDAGERNSFSDNNKQLTITNVSRTDSGKYRCVAENRVGSDISDAATLDVQCKTSIFADSHVVIGKFSVSFPGKKDLNALTFYTKSCCNKKIIGTV